MKNKNRVTWTEENFRIAVKNSKSLTEVIRTIGLKPQGWNYKTVKKYIALWNLDTSHFQTDWKSITSQARQSRAIIPNKEFFIDGSTISSQQIKKRLIKDNLVENKCSLCSINSWHGQELVLHMDHVNGVNTDNRLENLRLLCPNCHSLTSTYCGKNRKDKKEKKKYFCPDCSVEIYSGSNRCMACSRKRKKNAIVWPDKSELLELISIHGYLGAARILNCSDNAIRKHLKKID